MTLAQLEINLGLRRVYLATGASIYRFARLPLVTEYEYELTAEFSGGLAYNPASGDGRMGRAAGRFRDGGSDSASRYLLIPIRCWT